MPKDRAFCEDWACSSFRDLAVCQFFETNLFSIHPFQEYIAFYCLQCIEKLFKALAIKKNKLSLNTDLKKYSHNLKKLISDIELGPRQKSSLYHEFAKIGNEFHNGSGLEKTKINYPHTRNFSDENIDRYGPGLMKYSLFIDILKSAYLDTRYPKHYQLTDIHQMNLDEGVFLNIPILIATIKTFKTVVKFLGKSTEYYLWMNFTWEAQQDGFDDPENETIDTYLSMEKMLSFILNKKASFRLGNYIIDDNSYSLIDKYTVNQEGWAWEKDFKRT